MKKDSMMDNPVYDQVSPLNSPSPEHQESSTSFSNSVTAISASIDMSTHVAPNPVDGVETARPKPHRSTIRKVQNPVYGDLSDKQTMAEGNVYSSVVDQPSLQQSADETGEQEYSYAMVETKVALSQLGEEEVKGRDTVNTCATQEQSDVSFVDHKYAAVDMSAKARDNAASLRDQTVLLYDQLKHKHREQCQTRLVENKELGYSAFMQ